MNEESPFPNHLLDSGSCHILLYHHQTLFLNLLLASGPGHTGHDQSLHILAFGYAAMSPYTWSLPSKFFNLTVLPYI